MEQLGEVDDADEKATVWNREGCGDGQWLLCAGGASMDVSIWDVWGDGD